MRHSFLRIFNFKRFQDSLLLSFFLFFFSLIKEQNQMYLRVENLKDILIFNVYSYKEIGRGRKEYSFLLIRFKNLFSPTSSLKTVYALDKWNKSASSRTNRSKNLLYSLWVSKICLSETVFPVFSNFLLERRERITLNLLKNT